MSKELYKVLTKDCRSPFRGFAFQVGREYVCTDFDEDHSVECSRGFYATDIDGLPCFYNIHQDVWRCEVGGKAVEIDQFKRRYEKFRLIKKIEPEELMAKALEWESRVGYKISEVLFPINPLLIQREKKVSEEIDLLNKWVSVFGSVEASARDSVWASVWASVRDSVKDSVGDSVWDSVRDSVWDSVRDSVWVSVWDSVFDSVEAPVRDSVWVSVWASVRDSVWASVKAYIGSLFPNIQEWHYVKHKVGEYPFQSAVDLWKSGLVSSCDGKHWRLHAGENASVIYRIER